MDGRCVKITTVSLKTNEALALLNREKFYEENNRSYDFPLQGNVLSFEIFSHKPNRISFLLDISRKNFSLKKCTFQHRVYTSIILARLDLGSRHRNPDNAEIEGPHLHVYREGFGDKWAYPLSKEFTNPEDVFLTLEQFMNYCHIVKKPLINRVLF